MSDTVIQDAFKGENARSYDDQWSKLDPFRRVQHLLLDIAFDELPAKARILSVGAGTGQEILFLAEKHPGWSFVAVDPSADMLAVCREKMDAIGAGDRCRYHAGFLESLSETEPFDAATCLLVSHFLLDQDARDALFADIARRLSPGGHLVSADLSDEATDTPLFDFWLKAMGYAGISGDRQEQYRTAIAQAVALLPPAAIEAMLERTGFEKPVQILRTGLIAGWYARLPAPTS
ncbi:class I SAM-dependent methyltransferase [Parasphingopyxis marina]|uniref:Methyltransferase domain-containing protein n=1 Tax=Parasphingopyxis marina TaxID=2761622 RepID=A0A842HYT3_9SPHN|nr:class I SAM-dependent methyltransferase [Parasphingopyxis marina]MBC2778092.1 methyltransferase domain-containing protein [Parasphingopyxis marina]